MVLSATEVVRAAVVTEISIIFMILAVLTHFEVIGSLRGV